MPAPTPYFEDEFVTLYHGDCLSPDIIDVWLEADVLVTDPPYGVAYVSNHGVNGKTKPIEGDHTLDLRDEVLAAWRVDKGEDAAALVFGSWKVDRPEGTRHRLIWDKGEVGMGDLAMPWRPADEEIYVIGKGFAGPRTSNIIRCSNAPGRGDRPGHPTPKPVALMEALIEKCPPGTIADPFAGSGATLLAARNLGRRVIGVEVDEAYCEMIARRLLQLSFVFDEW